MYAHIFSVSEGRTFLTFFSGCFLCALSKGMFGVEGWWKYFSFACCDP
jgi:hypothetical protein